MIQANELRIGNWIQTERGRHKMVENIFGDRFNIKFDHGTPFSDPLTEMEGIPLTPEILEKCGFEKQDGKFYHPNVNPIFFVFKGEYGMEGLPIKTRNFKYLHQLQNLYFTLTGTELETKNIVEV